MPQTKDEKRFGAFCRMMDAIDGNYHSATIDKKIQLRDLYSKMSLAFRIKVTKEYPSIVRPDGELWFHDRREAN